MVKYNNKKHGFSLAETLISMLIISIFFIATAKVITHKQNVHESYVHQHGFYECYVLSGRLMEFHSEDDIDEYNNVDVCHYTPPQNIRTFIAYNLVGNNVYIIKDSQFDNELDINQAFITNFHNRFDEEFVEKTDINGLLLQGMAYIIDDNSPSQFFTFLRGGHNNLTSGLFISW